MKELEGKRILILQQRGWATTIGKMLATHLHAEGARLAALTLKRTTHEYILNQKAVPYEMIINNDEIMAEPEKYIGNNPPSLTVICHELGVDSVWPIVMTLRNHVRTYGEQYYYAYRQNVQDEQIVQYVQAVYLYIERIFKKFGPELILTPNFVSLPHVMLSLYAKRHGVNMIGVTDSKVRSVFLFTHGHNDDCGALFERLQELKNGERSPSEGRAAKYIDDFRKSYKPTTYAVQKKSTLLRKLRRELSPMRAIFNWYTKPRINYLPNLGVTLDYRPPKIILRDFYAEKKYRKYMERFEYYPFDKLNKYIYFPLQFQPEASIDVIAPFFSNQLETARLVAMSLPDDYTLAVKEHPAMLGFRAPDFLEKISRTPNIKLIDYRISSDTVIKKSAMLVCTNGTTLAEAAFYNKPAIQMGNLGTTTVLPNVSKHTDMTTLAAAIKEHLTFNADSPEYERSLRNYVSATYDVGMEYDYIQAWENGNADENALWQPYLKEIVKNLA